MGKGGGWQERWEVGKNWLKAEGQEQGEGGVDEEKGIKVSVHVHPHTVVPELQT